LKDTTRSEIAIRRTVSRSNSHSWCKSVAEFKSPCLKDGQVIF
jgi:hypothetical protein